MTIAGSPDFITQSGDTNTYIGSITYNTLLTKTLDITSLIDPSMQGLVIIVIPDAGAGTSRVAVFVVVNPSGLTLGDRVQCSSGVQTLMPFDGGIIAQGSATQVLVEVTGFTGDPAATGVIQIYAVTSFPIVYPARKFELSGIGESAALVVAAATTTVIMTASPAGVYRRVRALSAVPTAALAGTNIFTFIDPATSINIWSSSSPIGTQNPMSTTIDWSTQRAVSFVNPSTVPVLAVVAYEEWPV